MDTVELEAEARTTSGKGPAPQTRRAGKVPGILYGPKSHATMISIDAKEFGQKVSALEGSHLIQFRSNSGELAGKVVLVQHAQYDPVSGRALHADFYEVDLTAKIRVAVPLHFVGKAVGVAMGGIMQPLEREVQVECLPGDIPEFINVDVAALNIHDTVHISDVVPLLGAARTFSALRNHWTGTLMLIGQPSEETVSGSARMMGDGLYSRFGRPEAALSFHVAPDLPEGVIGYREGIFTAGRESLDIAVRGVGGHAAHPEQTRDPVVATARIILAFQTIVSREVPPDEFAIITVASVHGGLKHNAIPEEVTLQVNIRYFDPDIRDQLLAAIRRTAEGVAISSAIPMELMPRIDILPESVPPLVNDPALTARIAGVFVSSFGGDRVRRIKPLTGSEDFGFFAQAEPPVPVCYFRLGCDDGTGSCGFLHTSRFSPDPRLIRTAVSALVVGLQNRLGWKLSELAISELHRVYLSLGSNIEPEVHLPKAIKLLREYGQVTAVSNKWESESVGTKGPNYLNASVLFLTQNVRFRHQRPGHPTHRIGSEKRSEDKYAPRTIDIDDIML